MYHLMGRVKESQYARLCLLLAVCCVTVFIFINLNCPSSRLHHVKVQRVMSSENDQVINSDTIEPSSTEQTVEEVDRFPGEMITGGLNQVHEKDDEVTEVVEKIKVELEAQSGKKFESLEVIHYRPQLVAGKNYFVKAKAKEVGGTDQIVHLRIYKPLRGDLELTAYQLDKQLEEELTYFQ